MGSSEEVYEKFVSFCSISLKGENPKFLDFIKSRYESCEDGFRASDKMVSLLERTQRNMSNEESRKFVHLKHLLTELKKNAHCKKKTKFNKRKLCTDSGIETEHTGKVRKLKDCSVVVNPFPHFDTPLSDQNNESDDNPKLYARKACSIADGNVDSAPCILVANDDQMEDLRKELLDHNSESHLSSMGSLDSSSRGGEIIGKNTITPYHGSINGSGDSSLHSYQTSDYGKEKSQRKSVSIVGVDDIAEENCIRTGTLVDNPSVSNLHISKDSMEQEPLSWQAENDNYQINNTKLKTPTFQSTFKTVSVRSESPKDMSNLGAGIKLSDSKDLFVAEWSSSCKRQESTCTKGDHKEFPPTKSDHKGNYNMPSQLDCVDTSQSAAGVSSKNCSFLETESCYNVQSTTKSDQLSSTSNEEIISDTLSSLIPEKHTLGEPVIAPQFSPPLYISASISITSLKSEKTFELQGNHNDINHFDKRIMQEEAVLHDSAVSRKPDTTTVIFADSVDKMPKRVPLLPCTKTDTYSSSSLFSIKQYSHDSQIKAAQEPISLQTDCKAGASWMEDQTLGSGALADGYQKENEECCIGLNKDKVKQRRIIKLEHLLTALRNEIEKCQDTEMSLEDLDDENTAYLYEHKLKRKFVAVWNKLCEITERSVTTGRPTEKTIRYSGTRYKEINHRIQKFLNKKKMFPDFHDVMSIVKLTNKKCKLNLSAMMINDVAREAFVDIGEMLQTRRHQDFIATFGTRQTDILRTNMDPYLTDPELRRKVDSNRQVARLNLDSVIAKYTQLQYDRNCPDDDAQEEDEDDVDDETDRKTAKNNIEVNEKEKITQVFTGWDDYDTAASIEMDMAEEGDGNEIDFGSSTCCIQNPVPCNITTDLIQMPDLLTSEKDEPTTEKAHIDHEEPRIVKNVLKKPICGLEGMFVSMVSKGEDECSRFNASNLIIIDESPTKNLGDPWKSDSFIIQKKYNADSEKVKHYSNALINTARKGPNIKYTERKFFSNSELIQHVKKIEKALPYTYEKYKVNAESGNTDEEEDQSSDSVSEIDADDKNVDDDVDEIVMIMERSESEHDTASSRGPSPISVVSLSSGSLSENDDKDENRHVDISCTAVKICADKKQVSLSSLNTQNKHWHMHNEKDSLEKRLFLHAMGIHKSDNDDPSSICFMDEKLCTMDNGVDHILGQVIEEEEKTQTHTVFSSITAGVNQQEQIIAEKCFFEQDSLTPKKTISQCDYIIISETPVKAMPLADSSTNVEKGSLYSENVHTCDKVPAMTGIDTNTLESKRDKVYTQLSPERSNWAENNVIAVNGTRSTNFKCIQTMEKCGEKMLKYCDNKNVSAGTETYVPEIADNTRKKSKLCVTESFSTEKKDTELIHSEVSEIEFVDESDILISSLTTDIHSLKVNHIVPKTGQNNVQLKSGEDVSAANIEHTLLNKLINVKHSHDNRLIQTSVETSLKPQNDRNVNEDVIILDDSSVDQSFCQDSQGSLIVSQFELPLHKEDSSCVKSQISSNEAIKPTDMQIVDYGISQDSYSEIIDISKDVQDGHENGQKSPVLLLMKDIAACCQQLEGTGTKQITDQDLKTKDKSINEISVHAGTLVEKINNCNSYKDISEVPRVINFHSISKQTVTNHSEDLFDGGSITVTNNDNDILKEHTEPAVKYVLLTDCLPSNLLNTEYSSVESKQIKVHSSGVGGLKDEKLAVGRQGLHHGTIHSVASNCGLTCTMNNRVEETQYCCDIVESLCHFPEDEGSTCTNIHKVSNLTTVSAENINIDIFEAEKTSIGDCVECGKENVSNKNSQLLSSNDVDRNSKENTSHVIDDDVDLLSSDSQFSENADEDCGTSTLQNTNFCDTRISQSADMLVLHNLDTEGEAQMCSLNSDIASKNLSTQTQEDYNDSMQHSSLVISSSQSNNTKKTATDGLEESSKGNSRNLISLTEVNETVAEMVEASHSDGNRDSSNIIEVSQSGGNKDISNILEVSHFVRNKDTSNIVEASHSVGNKDTSNIVGVNHSSGNKDFSNIIELSYSGGTEDISSIVEVSDSGGNKSTSNILEVSDSGGNKNISNIVEVNHSGDNEGAHSIVKVKTDGYEKSDQCNRTDVMGAELVNFHGNEIHKDNKRKDEVTVHVNKDAKHNIKISNDKQKKICSQDDEDEIKIIEELSSVKGIRTSENTKEDDRKLVDQLLLNIDLNKSKESRFFPGSSASLVPGCLSSGECWEICDNVDAEVNSGHSNFVKKTQPKKRNTSLNTIPLQCSSVSSLECDEAFSGEELKATQLQTVSSVDLHADIKSSKAKEHEDSGEENVTISSSIIDVELLQKSKKQKIDKPDFITDIISSVFSELQPVVKTGRTCTHVAKPKSLVKGATCKTAVVLSKSSEQSVDDDEDVVIMEETRGNCARCPNFPAALHSINKISSKTSAVLKKHSSSGSYNSMNKIASSTTSPLQIKKHSVLQTYKTVKNASPSFQSHGKMNVSQSLPRLMPRVPIPSIQPNRVSESIRTSHRALGATAKSFANRQSLFSGRMYSSSMNRPNIRLKPQMSDTSLSRKKSGTASHSNDRLHSQQSSPRVPHNVERHNSRDLLPSISHQGALVQIGTGMNTVRDSYSQQKDVDGMEIILEDSDDDGDFNNPSSGPRIISVSSLSSTQMHYTSQSDFSNVSKVQDQPHGKSRDIIIIPD